MDSNGLVKYFVDNGSGYSEVYESTVTASGEYYVLGTPDGSGSTVSGTITGILTPATWTMEPTFEDDFSNTGLWVKTGTAITVDDAVNDTLYFNTIGGATTDRVSRTLSSELDDTKWEMRFKFKEDVAGTEYYPLFAICDQADTFQNVNNGITLFKRGTAIEGANALNMRYRNGGTPTGGSSSQNIAFVTGTQYYIEIKRTSSTGYTLSIFDDADYSNHITSSPQSFTIASTVTGLDILTASTYFTADNGLTKETCRFNDLKIYNGVTTIN